MPTLLTKRTFFHITLAIVLPILALGIPARILDKRLHTAPWILLAAIFISLQVTLVILLFWFKKLFSSFTTAPQGKIEARNPKP